jgi:hypothetical protein
MKKGFLIPIGLLLSAGVIVTLVVVAPKIQKKGEFAPIESSPESVSAGQQAILNWKLYENLEYRLRFQYPAELEIEELPNLGPNYMQINILDASQKAQAIFMIRTVFQPEEALNFVGSSPQDVKTINGLTWDFYSFPQGYSNSPPFTVYQGKKADILYAFKFYNVMSDELRDRIMATLEILPPPQNAK